MNRSVRSILLFGAVLGVSVAVACGGGGGTKLNADALRTRLQADVDAQTPGVTVTCADDHVDSDGYGTYKCDLMASDPSVGTATTHTTEKVTHDGNGWRYEIIEHHETGP